MRDAIKLAITLIFIFFLNGWAWYLAHQLSWWQWSLGVMAGVGLGIIIRKKIADRRTNKQFEKIIKRMKGGEA